MTFDGEMVPTTKSARVVNYNDNALGWGCTKCRLLCFVAALVSGRKAVQRDAELNCAAPVKRVASSQ